MNLDFQGMNILITGGTSNIGQALIKAFHELGGNIIFTFNHQLPDDILQNYPQGRIDAYLLELDDLKKVDETVDMIIADHGKIDVLINNAGIYPARSLDRMNEEDYDKMMDINTKGLFFLSKAVRKHMVQGSIINISSINATNPAHKLIHYGMSKAAVEMATRCLAYEYGPAIRVNAIAPGLIYKEGQDAWIPGWSQSYRERSALHRLVDAKDVADTAVFLASDLSSAITGQIITVDCGISLAPWFYNEVEDE